MSSVNNIGDAALHVQAMTPLRRALLAREALVRAAGVEKGVVYGPAGMRLRKILKYTGRHGFLVVSFSLLIGRILAGWKAQRKKKQTPKLLFIGIGAIRERHLCKDIAIQRGLEPTFVDQRTPSGFASLPAPSIISVFFCWRKIILEAEAVLSTQDPYFLSLDIMTTIAMRCHELSYLVALFDSLHKQCPDVFIICSTADMAPHAACIAGFSTEYHQHGFLRKELVYPDFSFMLALTEIEAKHVSSRVTRMRSQVSNIEPCYEFASKVFLIAGIRNMQDSSPVKSLVYIALRNGYQVVIRPHPQGDPEFWLDIYNFEDVTIEFEGSFTDCLAKWRPAYVATWFSTTILDGLFAGAVPITFSCEENDLVFPFESVAISWPQNKLLLHCCMTDGEYRKKIHREFLDRALS